MEAIEHSPGLIKQNSIAIVASVISVILDRLGRLPVSEKCCTPWIHDLLGDYEGSAVETAYQRRTFRC